jgi:dienelactone hydrolase
MKIFTLTIFILLLGCSQRDSAIKENHKLYIPDGDGSFPVVIAIPGCSGVSLNGNETDVGRPGDEGDRLFRRHYPRMAKRLKDNGFMVFLIDYLSAEGVLNTCNGEIHPKRVEEYINMSLSFVKKNPNIDPSRIYVIGWSHGGSGLLEWLSSLKKETKDVNSVIAVYPGCNSINSLETSLPVLMILGEADDIAIPSVCTELVHSLPEETSVKVLSYPNARHGFDFTEGPRELSVGDGLTIGRNQKAGNEAWREILIFLKQN